MLPKVWTSALALAGCLLAGAASAATCRDPAGFDNWLKDIRQEARAQGISDRAIQAGLSGVTLDEGVLRRDRGQRVFKQSYEQFSARMISPARIRIGQQKLRTHAALLSQIEARYGVPGPVVIALWGLESDYGAVRGNLSVVRSIATLAYDCRRTEMFTKELFAALKIIDSGDLAPSQMVGAWAGEMGQTQFMASSYMNYAVDFDGDGRRDLIRSVPDVLASTANFLRGHGWQKGQPWGPGTANYAVFREWNRAAVYQRTIAEFATRLAAGSRSAEAR